MPSSSDLQKAVEDPASAQARGKVAPNARTPLQLLNLALELVVLPSLLLEILQHVLVGRLQAFAPGELRENEVDLEPRFGVGTLVGHPLVDGLAEVIQVAVELHALTVQAALERLELACQLAVHECLWHLDLGLVDERLDPC